MLYALFALCVAAADLTHLGQQFEEPLKEAEEERRRPAIAIGTIISAAGLGVTVTDYLIKNIPRNPETTDNGNPCWWTCHKDKCTGSYSNPLIQGKSYYKGPKSVGGCCAFWAGSCSQCCLDLDL